MKKRETVQNIDNRDISRIIKDHFPVRWLTMLLPSPPPQLFFP